MEAHWLIQILMASERQNTVSAWVPAMASNPCYLPLLHQRLAREAMSCVTEHVSGDALTRRESTALQKFNDQVRWLWPAWRSVYCLIASFSLPDG